jgi:serine phosphatase RsbU (regulator of sigma subunit)
MRGFDSRHPLQARSGRRSQVVRQSSAKAPPPVRFWASPPIIALVAAFLATALAGPLIGVGQLDAASGAQIRLTNARSDLDDLLRIQLDEETALRGYVSTKNPLFLDTQDLPTAFDERARAFEDRLRPAAIPGANATVEEMRRYHAQWEREVKRPLLADPSAPNAAQEQAEGKFITDQMSRDARTLRDQLTNESRRVEQTLRRRINATVAISAGIITVFAIAALWYAIGRATAMARLVQGQILVDALQRTLRVNGQRPPHMQMGYAYASATREALIGGDVLDAWRPNAERGWFLIADASGKGVEAARHAAFAQYAIRALAAGADDPADVVTRFNTLFIDTFESDDPTVFVVLFLGVFDARAQTLRYASAGHGTAYVRRGTLTERLPPTGPIVGLGPGEAYATETVPLALGDIVLLATDGLGEARSTEGEMLGEERVAALLRDAPSDPQALCDLLVAAADAYSGGVQDDLAIIALRVVQDEESASAEFSPIGESASA